MTLNEKYCDLVDNDNGFDNQLLADRCEKIADLFAVKFARFIVAAQPKIFNNGSSMGQALVLFKKSIL